MTVINLTAMEWAAKNAVSGPHSVRPGKPTAPLIDSTQMRMLAIVGKAAVKYNV